MCISDTKGSHADLTDDYAAIRREMESVAEQFGKKVLREVDEDKFYKALPKLRKAVGDRAVVRAMHFYNDCRRAAQLCDAVREDDFENVPAPDYRGRSLQLLSSTRTPTASGTRRSRACLWPWP
mgnify:CR=1 FL=1